MVLADGHDWLLGLYVWRKYVVKNTVSEQLYAVSLEFQTVADVQRKARSAKKVQILCFEYNTNIIAQIQLQAL